MLAIPSVSKPQPDHVAVRVETAALRAAMGRILIGLLVIMVALYTIVPLVFDVSF